MFKDNSLAVRVVSAVLAASFLIAIYWFLRIQGLTLICLMIALLSVREFKRLMFHPSEPLSFAIYHSLLCLFLILALFVFHWPATLCFGVTGALFLGGMIVLAREKITNERLLFVLGLGLFSFYYCILCPWFAFEMVQMKNGDLWFLFLLLVVFASDTFAYFGGRFFGRRPLNPSISPKKTIEGALSGVLGSLVVSLAFYWMARPDLSLELILPFGLLSGALGQTGDLLMSLVKRVSHVKDSGRLLPGHGGALDRVDGVLLVCPLIYTLATLVH